ncbi:MAG: formimidoylglutamase [Bacteroidota bacterium]
MDLKLFFDPVDEIDEATASSFQNTIYLNQHKMPDLEGMDLALVGLCEFRGSGLIQVDDAAKNVRGQLYKLQKGLGRYNVLDLGNLRNGPTLEDTYLRIKEVCSFLLRKGILPILFGGTDDLSIGQFYGYEDSEKLISYLNIDSRIDLEGTQESQRYLSQIFRHSPNFLFNYYHVGYQSYLTGQKDLELLESLSFESYRLGLLKENIKEVEPTIRDADMLTIDMSALQSSYAPGAAGSTVFGLTGEEACQIAWYAGQNEKLSSIGLYNYFARDDTFDQKTSFVLATMIWYFIEGFYNRKDDKGFQSDQYLLYEVHFGGDPETIRFYKSKKSDRWWIEIPNSSTQLFDRTRVLPCSHRDYELAVSGELPERWVNYFSKT